MFYSEPVKVLCTGCMETGPAKLLCIFGVGEQPLAPEDAAKAMASCPRRAAYLAQRAGVPGTVPDKYASRR